MHVHPELKSSPHCLTWANVPRVLVLDNLIVVVGIGGNVLGFDLGAITSLCDILAEVFDRSCRGTYLDVDVGIILVAEVWIVWHHVLIGRQESCTLKKVLTMVFGSFVNRIPVAIYACFSAVEGLRIPILASSTHQASLITWTMYHTGGYSGIELWLCHRIR